MNFFHCETSYFDYAARTIAVFVVAKFTGGIVFEALPAWIQAPFRAYFASDYLDRAARPLPPYVGSEHTA